MLVKQIQIDECWCEMCHFGMMSKIHSICMSEHVHIMNMKGRIIQCDKCKHENVLEDIITVIPTSFFISDSSFIPKMKSDESVKDWLNSQD